MYEKDRSMNFYLKKLSKSDLPLTLLWKIYVNFSSSEKNNILDGYYV